MLRLFFILVLVILVQMDGKEDPLTKTKETNSSMQSMLLFEDSSEEKGLRPQRAAPQEGKREGQEQEKKETWEPIGVAPNRVHFVNSQI